MDAVTDATFPPDAAGASGRESPAVEPFQELVDHARQIRVVVIGGGIAGLVAAWECAKVGMSVTLVEASARLGGSIGSARIADIDVELGATCWSTRGGAVRRLVEDVLPGAAIVRSRDDREWIAGLPRGGAGPLPVEQVLGIPANPWDESVRRLIGWGGTWRAYLDRLRPPLTIGTQRSLGRLVGGRMGDKVRDRLVAPLTVDRFGLHADDVDVEIAAPGLSTALTRTGSLGGAVADVRLGTTASSIEGLDGGMPQLVAALGERLADRGAVILTDARATSLRRFGGEWTVGIDAATPGPALDVPPGAAASGGVPPEPAATGGDVPPELAADAVVVATDETAARALLATALEAPAFGTLAAAGIAREVVTLVVHAPVLDAAPRGAHVHAVPGGLRATGLVHETARWEWLAREAGQGRHVLRVGFGGPGVAPATTGLSDADAAMLARGEASALLGVPVDALRIEGAHRAAYTLVPPVSARGQRERAAAARAEIGPARGVVAVGAWLSGSGLAQVVADAQTEADRLRRSVLWGGAASE
jgi:oxygen-dependent protoporphyrinogen oxidase